MRLRFWHVLLVAGISVMLMAAVAPPPILRQILTTNTLAAGNAGEFLTRVGVDGIAFATLPQNGSANNGVVLAGGANFNKVWKTDGAGNPAWRDDATNSAGYIEKDAGTGTNTTFYGSSAATNWTQTGTNGWLNTNVIGGSVRIANGSITANSNLTVSGQSVFQPNVNSSNVPPVKVNMSSTTNGLEFYDVNGVLCMCVTTNGRVLLPNGTNNWPALGWISEDDGTGMGLFRSAASVIDVALNGSVRERLNASGFDVGPGAFFSGVSIGSPTANVGYDSTPGVLRTFNSSTIAVTNRLYYNNFTTNRHCLELAADSGNNWFAVRSMNINTGIDPSTNKPLVLGVGTNVDNGLYLSTNGLAGFGTNSPKARLHVTANNAQDYVLQAGTTNRQTLLSLNTNGNTTIAGTLIATNGVVNIGAASSIADLTITTNSTQIWCLNGTNQLVTLPDCTKIPAYQVFRFSGTNGYGSVVITNATGSQSIRDGTSLDYKVSGVFSVAFFTDGATWLIASKAKTIWANASWSTTTNVPFAVATSNYVTFNQLETSNGQGITLTNGYQIYVRDFGQYMLTFSVVMQVGHNNDTNRIWLQQSGQNIPRTRTDIKLSNTTEQDVMTVNFILPVTTNLTWFGICLRSTDTGAQLVSGAAADATMPAMPPAIVTINKISDTFP